MAGEYLRRYTQLPSLLYMLSKQVLTLLDPNSWDDKNDSYFLEQYKKKYNLATVLALCFSKTQETYHHWSIFANGSAGVCVQFKRDILIKAIHEKAGVQYGEVRYPTLSTLGKRRLKAEKLPFTKRHPYMHESEWRIVYVSEMDSKLAHDISIPINSIDRIILSPWLPKAHMAHVKDTVLAIRNCANLKIVRSTLISNERWKRMGENAV